MPLKVLTQVQSPLP